MTSNEKLDKYQLDEGEKISSIMAYTLDLLVWGDVITRQAVRVSTWLRTPMVPQYITLHSAQVVTFAYGTSTKSQAYEELHLPTSSVIAFHLKPPARDELDYDPNEPYRKMEPVIALVGSFRFDGHVRMSTQTTLARYLDVTKESFTPMYEVEITQPALPAMGVIRVPYVLLRRDLVLFSPKTT